MVQIIVFNATYQSGENEGGDEGEIIDTHRSTISLGC